MKGFWAAQHYHLRPWDVAEIASTQPLFAADGMVHVDPEVWEPAALPDGIDGMEPVMRAWLGVHRRGWKIWLAQAERERSGMPYVHIDTFQGVDTPTRKTRYQDFRAAVLKVGRFSVYEATATATAAKLFNALELDPEIETSRDCGFPWITVKRKPLAPAAGTR